MFGRRETYSKQGLEISFKQELQRPFDLQRIAGELANLIAFDLEKLDVTHKCFLDDCLVIRWSWSSPGALLAPFEVASRARRFWKPSPTDELAIDSRTLTILNKNGDVGNYAVGWCK